MKAIVHERYGPPGVLELRDVEKPVAEGDRVLVRVCAASVNPADWRFMRGHPYVMRPSEGLRRPRRKIPGADVAGVVEAVGPDVTRFAPGDQVFGGCAGSLAEYVRPREKFLVRKPSTLSFEHAAAIPTAGCTALRATRDEGRVRPEQMVLVNGAAGGVGTFAVQIAKAFGATVTGVCSTRNVEMVRSLGADEVVDYTRDDFARARNRYDVVIDAVGSRSFFALKRACRPGGSIVLVGGGGGNLLGPLGPAGRALALSKVMRQKLSFFLAGVTERDLLTLLELHDAGRLAPVIDRTYSLEEAADAIRHLETRHARGKIIITVGRNAG